MELGQARAIQGIRAEQLAVLAKAIIGFAPEAERSETSAVAARYADLAARLDGDTQFHTVGDGRQITEVVKVGEGTGLLTEIGLRFVRTLTEGSRTPVPSSIAAEWVHWPADNRNFLAEHPGAVFEHLRLGEVFASEHVDDAETRSPVDIPGADPRPLEERMTLLEQSFAEFIAAQGEPESAAGANPQ
jgi:hypothetical protein